MLQGLCPPQTEAAATPIKVGSVALLGSFGPPMLAAARSFHASGIDVFVVHLGRAKRRAWSSAVKHGVCLDPEDAGTPKGLNLLAEFLRRTQVQALLPFWDPQILWLLSNQDCLPRGCKLLASSRESLLRVLSKRSQIQLARECGLSVLSTWELAQREDPSVIPLSAYPVCLRPSLPDQVTPTFKAQLARSPAELAAFLRARTWGAEPLLAQSFLPAPTILLHGVRSEGGELLALEAFAASMKSEGLTLELRPAALDAVLAQRCHSFLERAGVSGPFHFEFLHCPQTGHYYYLELNVRLGGTTDKVLRMGFNEPLLTLAAYGFDVPLPRYSAPSGRPVVNRRLLAKHMRSVLCGRLSPMDYPDRGAGRHLLLSVNSLLRSKDSIASARDLAGTMLLYRGGPR